MREQKLFLDAANVLRSLVEVNHLFFLIFISSHFSELAEKVAGWIHHAAGTAFKVTSTSLLDEFRQLIQV
jgi:hypothetical protein